MEVKRVYVDCKEIKYFDINKKTGRVINSAREYLKTWYGTYFDMESIKVGKRPRISFNKKENEQIGKKAIYTKLNYKVTKIENLEQ